MIGTSIGTVRGIRIAGPGREFLIDEEPVDIFLADGRIVDIAPTGALRPTGEVLEADGAWAVPGLWDHHVHSLQWALSAERVPLRGAASASEATHLMGQAEPLADGRLVGTGFRDVLWADAPTREALDRSTGATPAYLINADVHSVWLNTAAFRREGIVPTNDGMLRETEAFEISRRLNAVADGHGDEAVRRAGERAAGRGVTGLVDYDLAWNADAWLRRVSAGFASHRVEFGIHSADIERAIAAGLRSGEEHGSPLVRVGSLKTITDGSLGTRTAACAHHYPGDEQDFGVLNVAPAELSDLLVAAIGAGLAVAVHAIGDRAVTAALDAFTTTGASGTIEHAQLVRHSDLARFARLGIAASVQPQHALDDRDVVDEYWAEQTSLRYPLAALRDAGATLLFGSDAPVAPLDPWNAIGAAVDRTDDGRDPWHPEQRITIDQALAASVRTSLRPGEPADIVVCGADPRSAHGVELREMPVRATLLAGILTHVS